LELSEAVGLKLLKKAVKVDAVPELPDLFCTERPLEQDEVDLYQSHPPSPATTRAYYPRAQACCDRGSIRNVVVDDDTYVSLVLQMKQRGRPWMMLLHLGWAGAISAPQEEDFWPDCFF